MIKDLNKREWPSLYTDLDFTWSIKDTIESLSKKVDKRGGWPPDAETLKLYCHCRISDRFCEFSENYINGEWYMIVLTKNQYFSYKGALANNAEADKKRNGKTYYFY